MSPLTAIAAAADPFWVALAFKYILPKHFFPKASDGSGLSDRPERSRSSEAQAAGVP
jgi:hypothetical protein